MIRKEAWSFYRTISGVRLCWELEDFKGPNGKGCHHSAAVSAAFAAIAAARTAAFSAASIFGGAGLGFRIVRV